MIVPGNTIKLEDIGTSNAVVPEVQSQSPVAKAVRNIKKKNAGAYIRLQPTTSQTDKTNTQKKSENAASGRGVVYLSHIPDGFYEDEMRQYFSQFGRVTRVKLARSRKTGRSRGYAFIEFQYAEVAKVVAETMNNYLLYNRLLKASYVDKQYPAAFWIQQSWGPQNCPLAKNRQIEVKRKNAMLNPAKELAQQGKRHRQLAKTLNRLKDAGVDYTLEVKDQAKLSSDAEKKARKFGSAKNMKQEKQGSGESVKVEEESRIVQPVLLVDESDDEIEFNVPSFVIRKTLKRQSSSPSTEHSPKMKAGKRVKTEPLTPKITSPTPENLSSPENHSGEEASSGTNHKTRKSGRVSVIPKHISSGFHVNISSLKSKQKKTPGKENRDSQSPVKCTELLEQSSTPKVGSNLSPRSQKSVKTSRKRKSKNTKPTTAQEEEVEKFLENTEMLPKSRRHSTKATEIPDIVVSAPAADSVVRRESLLVDKSTGLTPNRMKNNTYITDKRKTPKLIQGEAKKTPSSSQTVKTVLPKSNGKTPSPNRLSPVHKANSGNGKTKMQKSPLKTPVGRKSFTLSKQSNGMRKPYAKDEKDLVLKTPVGRKSHDRSAASSPKLSSPLSHSTALKRNSQSPKVVKPARKSLKLNK